MKTTSEKQISQHKVIDIIKVFDTTPQRLFKAWTNEKDFSAWFGPESFEVIYCKIDLRVGGSWRSGISGNEGEFWMEGKYIEIVENERLVFSFNDGSVNKKPELETIITITFSKSENKTIMKFNQSVFKTVEARDDHFRGWSSGFICLSNYLLNSK